MGIGLKIATALLLLVTTTDAGTVQIIDANPSTAPATAAPTPAPTKAGDVARAVDTSKIALLAGSSQCTGDAIKLVDMSSDFKYSTTSPAIKALPELTISLLLGAILTTLIQAIL